MILVWKFTDDIDHFWQAFDSVATTTDTIKQADFIQRLYVDKATPGLVAFMKMRNYNTRLYVRLINQLPEYWSSIRSNTLSIKKQEAAISKSIRSFKKLYPEMRPAKMYFTIGGMRSGGTVTDDMVLVGAEIATADKNTNATALDNWLKNVFASQQATNLVTLNVHEYVHTQQKPRDEPSLLAQSIVEGSADFIAELVTRQKADNSYTIYGRAHEQELKEKFKEEMFTKNTANWLYNGTKNPNADLGYFMGYAICTAYYQNHADKMMAIKKIIELDYSKEEEVAEFLNESGYYRVR